MTTIERLIKYLDESPGQFFDVPEIAEALGVSRQDARNAAVRASDNGRIRSIKTRDGYGVRYGAATRLDRDLFQRVMMGVKPKRKRR